MQRNNWILYFGLATLVVAAAACRTSNPSGNEGSGAQVVSPESADDDNTEAWWDPGEAWGLADEPTKGSSDALVTIVEFSDFQCGYCNRVRGTLDEILEDEDFGDKVRIIMLQHPLDFHPQANLASQAALAAHDQGKYWEYHDILFDNMRALERENLEEYAEQLELDMDAFRAALDDETHAARIDEHLEVAGDLGIRGTPNFMINGRNVTGARPFDSFAEVIREEVEAMEALIEEGKTPAEAYAARLETNLEDTDEPADEPARPARPTPDPNAELYVPVGDSPFKGPEDALITIVEFSDFQCPFCGRVNPTLEQVFEEFEGNVRVVFKHNALSFHDRAEPAARGSIAAQRQGKFWEYHDLLFENQRALSDDDLASYAEQLGLDMDQWREDFNSESAAEHVATDMALAQRLSASGTPHFFINGYRLRGAQPFARFQSMINERLEEANELVEAGTPRAGIYAALQEDAIRGNAPMIQPPAGNDRPTPRAEPENNDPVEIDVSGAPSKGPDDAAVTIVEFTDFQCPYCSRFANALDEAIEPYGDQVRVVVMSFPLSFHQQADLAAQASIAADAQGKYWEYHDLLFANQRALERDDLERYAEQIGLDMDQFRAALDNETYSAQVQSEMARGRAAGITGTPGWFVNGVKFGGARPVAAIRAEIDRALEAE